MGSMDRDQLFTAFSNIRIQSIKCNQWEQHSKQTKVGESLHNLSQTYGTPCQRMMQMQDIYMGSIGDWASTWKRFIVGFKQTNENSLTKFPDLKIAESCESIKEYHMFVLLSSLSINLWPLLDRVLGYEYPWAGSYCYS